MWHKLLGHVLHQEIVKVRHAVRGALLLTWSGRRRLILVRSVILLLAISGWLVGAGRLALTLLFKICRRVTRLQRELRLGLLTLGGLDEIGRVCSALNGKALKLPRIGNLLNLQYGIVVD